MSNDLKTKTQIIADRFMEKLVENLSLITKTNRNFNNDFINGNHTVGKHQEVAILCDATEDKMAKKFDTAIEISELKETFVYLKFGDLYDASFNITDEERFFAGDERTINAAIGHAIKQIKYRAESLVLNEVYKDPDVIVLPNGKLTNLKDFASIKSATLKSLNANVESGRLLDVVAYINSETLLDITTNEDIYKFSNYSKFYFDNGTNAGTLRVTADANKQAEIEAGNRDYELTIQGLDFHRHDFLERQAFRKYVLESTTDEVVTPVADVKYTSVLETNDYKVLLTNESAAEITIPKDRFIQSGLNAHYVKEDIVIGEGDTLDVTSLIKINDGLVKEETAGDVVVKSRSDYRNFVMKTDAVVFGMVAPTIDNSDVRMDYVFDPALNIGFRVINGDFNTVNKSKTVSVDAYITAQKFGNSIAVF